MPRMRGARGRTDVRQENARVTESFQSVRHQRVGVPSGDKWQICVTYNKDVFLSQMGSKNFWTGDFSRESAAR